MLHLALTVISSDTSLAAGVIWVQPRALLALPPSWGGERSLPRARAQRDGSRVRYRDRSVGE